MTAETATATKTQTAATPRPTLAEILASPRSTFVERTLRSPGVRDDDADESPALVVEDLNERGSISED